MTARILVVDDILANVRLLEAKLSAEYFEVVTAMNGLDALEAIQRTKPDLVLLDVMMPGMDGVEVCKRIKANPATQHVPVVMVTALDQPEDRVRGLEAGADDFLTKPVNDISLFCRIKSLVRLKMLTDELRIRAGGGDVIGLLPKLSHAHDAVPSNIMLVECDPVAAERIQLTVGNAHKLHIVTDPARTLDTIADLSDPLELIIVGFDQSRFDGLRLCSQLRSLEATRQTPILTIVGKEEQQLLLRALDMGVNDYLMRPIDRLELMARITTQVKRWRYADQLRASVKASVELAICDPLTGLYNRRYLNSHLAHMIDHYVNRGKLISVLAIDVDFFKAINDTYGHDGGDAVLQEIGFRLRDNTRAIDLCCRTGGEEFIIVLPGTDSIAAAKIAERLRRSVASRPFKGSSEKPIPVTISVGLATLSGVDDTMDRLLKRADDALYTAKREGRNRVVKAAA